MKVVVTHQADGPEVLKLDSQRVSALVRFKAFGLDSSELFVQQGHGGVVAIDAFETDSRVGFSI